MADLYPIPNYAKYQISRHGQVYSLIRNKYRKPQVSTPGYLYYNLSNDDGKIRHEFLHRLIGTVFIPNPENKPCINHKDGNKLNNNLDNLEWVTYKENSEHAVKTGLHHHTAVNQYDKSGRFIQSFRSIKNASGKTNTSPFCISGCCTGTYKTAGGFVWKYSSKSKKEDISVDLKYKQRKKVAQYTLSGNLVDVYHSVEEASRTVDGTSQNIGYVATNGGHSKNFQWVYVNNNYVLSMITPFVSTRTGKCVRAYKDGELLKTFDTVKEAALFFKRDPTNISKYIRKIRNDPGGLVWKYGQV